MFIEAILRNRVLCLLVRVSKKHVFVSDMLTWVVFLREWLVSIGSAACVCVWVVWLARLNGLHVCKVALVAW